MLSYTKERVMGINYEKMSEQMDTRRHPGAAAPLQHRYCLLLVHLQREYCRVYRFYEERYGVGIQLRDLFPWHVRSLFG